MVEGNALRPHNGNSRLKSALGGMKRSWSGNEHDLGNQPADQDFTVLGTKRAATRAQSSSPEIPIPWSDSPEPEPRPRNTGNDENKGLEPTTAKRRKSSETRANPAASSASAITRRPFQPDPRPTDRAQSIPNARHPTLTIRDPQRVSSSVPPSDTTRGTSSRYNSPTLSGTSGQTASSRSKATATPQSVLSYIKSADQLKEERKRVAAAGLGDSLPLPSSSFVQMQAMFGAQEKKNVNKIFLSTEQRSVLKMVVEEAKNVFFTGSAGTGKSVLLREIIKELRYKHKAKADAVAVTASTGIAACNVGGVTLHSFGGVGLGKETAQQLVSKIKRNRKATARWLRTNVLIIDEISMVEPELFDKLEEIARTIRRSAKPFGGIQVVITGDFFQLPPVQPNGRTSFAFEAQSWDSVVAHKINLTQVFRQKDSTFVQMLNEMRFGKLSESSIQKFRQLERKPNYDLEITPTELFPRREDVDRANYARLKEIKSEEYTFTANDSGEVHRDQLDKICSNFMAVKVLTLKVGAQVMLIKNLDETLVNGSIGKVIAFMDEREYTNLLPVTATLEDDKEAAAAKARKALSNGAAPIKFPLVRFIQPNGSPREYLVKPETWKSELPNGEVQAMRCQVPLILAWAMSIHKSQGQTLPCCRINLTRVFEKGQAYVALSRATSLEGLQVFGFDPSKVMAHDRVIQWNRSLFVHKA